MEKYMKESDVYRSFLDFWEKRLTFGECLDNVPKYDISELIGEYKHETEVQSFQQVPEGLTHEN